MVDPNLILATPLVPDNTPVIYDILITTELSANGRGGTYLLVYIFMVRQRIL